MKTLPHTAGGQKAGEDKGAVADLKILHGQQKLPAPRGRYRDGESVFS